MDCVPDIDNRPKGQGTLITRRPRKDPYEQIRSLATSICAGLLVIFALIGLSVFFDHQARDVMTPNDPATNFHYKSDRAYKPGMEEDRLTRLEHRVTRVEGCVRTHVPCNP